MNGTKLKTIYVICGMDAKKQKLIKRIEKYVLNCSNEDGIYIPIENKLELHLELESEKIDLNGVFNIQGEALVETKNSVLYNLDELTNDSLEKIITYHNSFQGISFGKI